MATVIRNIYIYIIYLYIYMCMYIYEVNGNEIQLYQKIKM